MAARKHAAVRKSDKTKTKKLSKEARKIVQEKATEIAKSLLNSTLEGHVLSARLLVELAEGDVETDEASTATSRSLALELAQEPEWPGETLDSHEEMKNEHPQSNGT